MQKQQPGRVKRLGNHVAALAQRDPLSLAEEVLCKQEHNLELKQQLKCLMTEKRHLEVELNGSRQAITQLLQQQQSGEAAAAAVTPGLCQPAVLSCHQMQSCMHTMQQQESQLQQARELECYDQAMLGHFTCVLQQVRAAVEAAANQGPEEGNHLAHDLLVMLEAFQDHAVVPAASASSPISSLALAQEAHKILLQQALLLRGKLARPASPSTARPGSAAAAHAGRPGSAGRKGSGSSSPSTGSQKAQDLLHFLHSHVQRMQEQVHALSAGGAGTALWQLHGAIDAPAGQQEVSRAGMQHAKPNLSKADSPSDGLSQTGHRLSVLGAVRPQTAAASAGRPRSPGPGCIRPQTASPHGSSSAQTAQLQGMRFCATAVEATSVGATQQHRWQSQDLHVVAQGADRGINREPVPGSVGYPDLTPYLVVPPRRPVSPPAASTATHRQQTPAVQQAGFADPAELQISALVQELQQLLADREQQLQLQHEEIRGLQEQLQEALKQHAQMQQQLQDTEAQANTAAGSCAALQQQLEAAQQAALAAHAQAEAKQKQLQDQLDRRADVAAESEAASESSTQQQLLAANEIAAAQASQINQLQQQLTAAEAQVLALQQSMHEQQVQHIQSQQEAHQLLAQSEAAATAAAAAAAALQEAHAVAGAGGGAGSSSPRGQLVQLLQSLQSYSRQLAGLAPAEALLSGEGELQDGVSQLCEALEELVVKLKEAASQLLQQPELNTSPSSATRSSCNTEALEGQLEATRVEVAHCMDMLTEVVAATRRMSMTGTPGQPDAPVKRFSQLEVEWHPLPASVARRTDDSV